MDSKGNDGGNEVEVNVHVSRDTQDIRTNVFNSNDTVQKIIDWLRSEGLEGQRRLKTTHAVLKSGSKINEYIDKGSDELDCQFFQVQAGGKMYKKKRRARTGKSSKSKRRNIENNRRDMVGGQMYKKRTCGGPPMRKSSKSKRRNIKNMPNDMVGGMYGVDPNMRGSIHSDSMHGDDSMHSGSMHSRDMPKGMNSGSMHSGSMHSRDMPKGINSGMGGGSRRRKQSRKNRRVRGPSMRKSMDTIFKDQMGGKMQKFGSRAQVMHKKARMTTGGLTKAQLKYNKRGKIVSKKASSRAKKSRTLIKAGYRTKKGKFEAFKKK